ncbi:MAG: hypothetical protein GXO43_01350 [Crenarchaeota archaeon]|nr:hypothetical protein [Thermoproteota archaeon]
MKKKFLSRKVEEASVNVRVEKGRISIAGRDYHSSHAFLKGCDKASIIVDHDNLVLDALFNRLPELREEDGAIVVYDREYSGEGLVNDTFEKITRRENMVEAVLIPLKLRVWGDKDGVQVFINDQMDLRSKRAEISVDTKSTINFITWPFPAVWIYVERADLVVKQDNGVLKITIKGM